MNDKINGILFLFLILIFFLFSSCRKGPAEFDIPSGPEGWTGCDTTTPVRITNDKELSKEPSLVSIGTGLIVVWRTEYLQKSKFFFQKLNYTGLAVNEKKQITLTDEYIKNPRIAGHENGILLIYLANKSPFINKESTAEIKALYLDINGTIKSKIISLGETDEYHLPDVVFKEDKYIVGWFTANSFKQATIDINQSADSEQLLNYKIEEIPWDKGEKIYPGNISLVWQNKQLLLLTDTKEGWSIQLCEISKNEVKLVKQIISDKRNNFSKWAHPAIAPLSTEGLELLFEGPGRGVLYLYYGALNPEFTPYGVLRRMEPSLMQEGNSQVFIGDSPIYDPDIIGSQHGVTAVYVDSRMNNSEIMLLPMRCRR